MVVEGRVGMINLNCLTRISIIDLCISLHVHEANTIIIRPADV